MEKRERSTCEEPAPTKSEILPSANRISFNVVCMVICKRVSYNFFNWVDIYIYCFIYSIASNFTLILFDLYTLFFLCLCCLVYSLVGSFKIQQQAWWYIGLAGLAHCGAVFDLKFSEAWSLMLFWGLSDWWTGSWSCSDKFVPWTLSEPQPKLSLWG